MSIDEESYWEKELKFVGDLIKNDIHNNSVWNQRWCVSHRGKRPQRRSKQTRAIDISAAWREADFAFDNGIVLDPYNESSMRYLLGILREQFYFYTSTCATKHEEFALFEEFLAYFDSKLNGDEIQYMLRVANRDPDTCVNLISGRIELLEMMNTEESLKTAAALAEKLSLIDPIRKKYWFLVSKRLNKRYTKKSI